MSDDDQRADVERQIRALALRRVRAEQRRREIMDEARPIIRRGRGLGLTPTELATMFSTTRHTIYGLLGEAKQ